MSLHRQFLPHLPLVIFIFLNIIASSEVANGFLSGGPSSLPGVVEPSYSVLTEGSTLAINCILTTYSTTLLRSRSLYFTSIYENTPKIVNDTFYRILNESAMEMVILNVNKEDGTTFKCFVNDSGITGADDDTYVGTASADIGEVPYPIVNISIISENFVNMTVNWCPEVFQDDPVATTLFWHIEGTPILPLWSGNCPAWTNTRNCSCVFCSEPQSGVCLGKDQTFHAYQKYLINITSSNLYGKRETYVEVNTSPKIVKPGPVSNLKVDSVGSRQLKISWQYPSDVSFSRISQISVSPDWNNISPIDAGNDTSWILTELTPFTNYTIAVRCKPEEDGYWSDDSIVSVATLEDVPSVAPSVPIGFFRLSGCSSICNVTIFWQLINESLQNGVILGYQLSIKSKHCSPCDVFVSGSKQTSLTISFASYSESWVELVALTSVGDSPPQYIYFPSYFVDLPNAASQELYAEYTASGAGVYINWNYRDDVDNYTLMYCLGIQNDPNHCQNSPTNITIPKDKTNFTLEPADQNLVYSLSANYRNGTNGLTAQWLCVYDYVGSPAKPKLNSPKQLSDTSVSVSWVALQCDSVNRVRVLQYVLSFFSNGTNLGGNVTLPGNVTEYVFADLIPEISYELILHGVSRSGPGPSTTDVLKTTVPQSKNIMLPVVVTLVIVIPLVIIIIIIVICGRRYHRWCNKIDIKAPEKHEAMDIQNDSSAGCNPYFQSTVTLDSNSRDDSAPISSSSSEQPILQIHSSESDSSGTSNDTASTNCESTESIQTYTAVRPINYKESLSHAYSDPQQSMFSEPGPSDYCGYSQGKLDDKFESLVSNSASSSNECGNSGSSVDSSDNYKTTKLRDCAEPVGPPLMPQMVDIDNFV